MMGHALLRPVLHPSGTGVPRSLTDPATASAWPENSRRLAEDLHRLLAIDGRDWHALKAQKPRRAAEQIAAALVHLLADDSSPARRDAAAQQRSIALLEHALAWLKGDLSDPGCPSHGR